MITRDDSDREAELQDEFWGHLADDDGTPNIRMGDGIHEIVKKVLSNEDAVMAFVIKAVAAGVSPEEIRTQVRRGDHRRHTSMMTSAVIASPIKITPTPGEFRLHLVGKKKK